MHKGTAIVLLGCAVLLASCDDTPGKSEVQGALDRNLQGKDAVAFASLTLKPVVNNAECTKAGDDIYDCAMSFTYQDEQSTVPLTVSANARLTKLDGKWETQGLKDSVLLGSPSKVELQGVIDQLVQTHPDIFEDPGAKLIVDYFKCTTADNETYDCRVSFLPSNYYSQQIPSLKLAKVNGAWVAQIAQ